LFEKRAGGRIQGEQPGILDEEVMSATGKKYKSFDTAGNREAIQFF
jgi:hypothetical protein